MMNKKKPRIFHNMGLKIIALLFSIFLWILVTNLDNPLTSMTVSNVPVRLLHTNLITDQGKVYSVLDDSDVVPVVTVRANRSIIDSLQSDNITATADVAELTSLNTVEIHFSSNKYNSEISSIKGNISTVKLAIEENDTRSFVLTTTTSGQVADGYQLGTVTPEQNQVRVSGPESTVSEIAKAEASVVVSGATGTISTYSDIRLYDASDNLINTDDLTMNITSVKVNVQVLPISDVPITAQYQGTPADGYLISGVLDVEPGAVGLSGKSSVLSTTQSIVIPPDQLDISGRTDSLVRKIDITPYLPEGVSFSDENFDGIVTVTVGIEPEETTQITADIADIRLTNVPDGYSAAVEAVSDGSTLASVSSGQTKFTFHFAGLSKDVALIQLAALSPSIDVGAILPEGAADVSGSYDAPVSIVSPDNAALTNAVAARVIVARQMPEPEPGTTPPGTANTGVENAGAENTGTSESNPGASEGNSGATEAVSSDTDSTAVESAQNAGATKENGKTPDTATDNSSETADTAGSGESQTPEEPTQ